MKLVVYFTLIKKLNTSIILFENIRLFSETVQIFINIQKKFDDFLLQLGIVGSNFDKYLIFG